MENHSHPSFPTSLFLRLLQSLPLLPCILVSSSVLTPRNYVPPYFFFPIIFNPFRHFNPSVTAPFHPFLTLSFLHHFLPSFFFTLLSHPLPFTFNSSLPLIPFLYQIPNPLPLFLVFFNPIFSFFPSSPPLLFIQVPHCGIIQAYDLPCLYHTIPSKHSPYHIYSKPLYLGIFNSLSP